MSALDWVEIVHFETFADDRNFGRVVKLGPRRVVVSKRTAWIPVMRGCVSPLMTWEAVELVKVGQDYYQIHTDEKNRRVCVIPYGTDPPEACPPPRA